VQFAKRTKDLLQIEQIARTKIHRLIHKFVENSPASLPERRSRSSICAAFPVTGASAFKRRSSPRGKHTTGLHEAWITADPFRGGFKVLITGPHGFERTVAFALDDDPAVIAERARETVEG
jgi:hypothetical protein